MKKKRLTKRFAWISANSCNNRGSIKSLRKMVVHLRRYRSKLYLHRENIGTRSSRAILFNRFNRPEKRRWPHYGTWRAALKMLIIVKRAPCSIQHLPLSDFPSHCHEAVNRLSIDVIHVNTSHYFRHLVSFSSKNSFSPSIGRESHPSSSP